MSKQNIFKASTILLVLFVASRVLGFVREQVIAALLGTTLQSDAFVVAATIPFTLSTIIGVSAGNALLPMYTGRLQDASRVYLASTVLFVVGALVTLLTVLGLIFTPQVLDLLAPGFTGEARRTALLCTQIMLPSTVFLTLGFLAKAVLNAHREFTVPAVAPVLQNIVFIALIIPLGGFMGPGLAWCTLAGALVFYLYNLPAMGRFGIPWRPLLDTTDPDVRRVLIMSIPVIITALASRGFVFVDRWFGSHLVEGSIAALNFANRIRELPYGLFVAVVSSVLFPALAAAAERQDMQLLRDRTALGLRLVALITYPSATLMLVLAVPVVRLLFERGAFDTTATIATASALSFYAFSVAAMSASSVLTYTFLSLRDALMPLWVGLAGLSVNIFLDYLLVDRMGHAGLALGNTIGSFVTAILFMFLLSSRLNGFDWRGQGIDQLKIIVATIIFSIILWLVGKYTGLFNENISPWGQLLGMTLAVGTAGAAYLLTLIFLNVKEIIMMKQKFIK
ncbi:murein biosynthesis integral membrane protein MurJ [Desulfoscipio gibsoniae]|uniref:Probable lipid II flippase MurJ n=1 Tax=Desulfoscipio gibsoniae DSM 7213 TaxID=767817 RepID=R4KSW2_9FIRM|nr:murein biosynthesis integral membrane protein MurJ [Desulfoscipio gibsoniae]AGL02686.1 integral membrane protein MviN [Desulfoscipio gibsoniae DSM 7213]